jgi:hypothetical protein
MRIWNDDQARLANALSALVTLAALLPACGREDSPPAGGPKGKAKQEDTRLLETGAQAIQSFEPITNIDTYIDGFHPMKDDPSHVMEAHHFCHARNEEFTQCVIFDANTANANLVGIEYIISERLYEQLAPEEKALWHPHNYEILSGQLVAPGLPQVAENAFLAKKLNSYGKTWHTWDTADADRKTMPLGPAMLAWSFNADGELPKEVEQERDKRMNIEVAQKREARKSMAVDAHPQRGVNALEGAFPQRAVPDFIKERSD